MKTYFLHLCIQLFIQTSNRATIERQQKGTLK